MDAKIYIAGGLRFTWKINITPSLIDERPKCKHCDGKGFFTHWDIFGDDDNNDGQCTHCNGSGREYWLSPNCPHIVNIIFQDMLNDYVHHNPSVMVTGQCAENMMYHI